MIFVLIGIIFLLYMFPATLAISITKWAREPITKKKKVKTPSGVVTTKLVKVQPELTILERLSCCIPILSACKVWKALFDRYGWTKFVAGIIPVGFIFRIVVVFFTESDLLFIISFYVLWLCIILHQLLYTIVYITTARLHQCSFFVQVLCIVFPEFAAYLLASQVPRVLRELWEDEDNAIME